MPKKSLTNVSESVRDSFYFNVSTANESVFLSTSSNQFNHNSRYEDYDSRPIKPLDTNLLQKQLEQYTELTQDELEEIRKKLKNSLFLQPRLDFFNVFFNNFRALLNIHQRSKTLQHKTLTNSKNQQAAKSKENKALKTRSKTFDSSAISSVALKIQQQSQNFNKNPSTTVTAPDKLDRSEPKSSKNVFTLKKTSENNRMKDYKALIQHKSLQNLAVDERKQTTGKGFTCKKFRRIFN
jgi:hypothetical protein